MTALDAALMDGSVSLKLKISDNFPDNSSFTNERNLQLDQGCGLAKLGCHRRSSFVSGRFVYLHSYEGLLELGTHNFPYKNPWALCNFA